MNDQPQNNRAVNAWLGNELHRKIRNFLTHSSRSALMASASFMPPLAKAIGLYWRICPVTSDVSAGCCVFGRA